MNKYTVILLLCVLLGAQKVFADTTELNCYYKDKCYTFTISSERQKSCPKWDPENQKNPPLAAAEALVKAKKFIETIKTDEGYAWEREELSLVDVHGWTWRVRFRLKFQGIWNGPPSYMDCYILMDGTVVEPILTRKARGENQRPRKD